MESETPDLNTFDLRFALCQCSNCGKIYPSTLRFGRGYFNGTDQDVRKLRMTWACPVCGKENRIRVELIEKIEKAIEAIEQIPLDVLLSLKSRISEKATKEFSYKDFHDLWSDIFSTIPDLKKLNFLNSKTTREKLNTLAAVIGAIFVVIPQLQGEKEPIKVETIINQNITIYNSYPKALQLAEIRKNTLKKNSLTKAIQKYNPLLAPKKTDPCICGSGKPYGKCHGK